MTDHFDRLVRDARSDPMQTITTTTQLLDGAESHDLKARLQLHHARGLALREVGETADSGIELAKAMALANELGDEDQWIAAAMSLGGTQLYAGEVAEGIDLFETVVSRAHAEARGPALLQLGTALIYAGDHEGALRRYDEALPLLQASSRQDFEADLLSNRSVLMVDLGRFEQAISDADAAVSLFEVEANPMGAATTEHNKAIALFRSGRLAEALQLFAKADATLAELGVPSAVFLVDKSEALLAGGFFDEAVRLSKDAASYFSDNGDEARKVEALVVGAEAALAAADTAAVLQLGAEALASPATVDLQGWRARAILAMLRAAPDHDPTSAEAWPSSHAIQIAELPAILESAGQASRVAEARLVPVRQALQRGDVGDAVELLDLQHDNELERAPFHVVLERRALEAEACERSANEERALAAVAAGLDAIEIVQATTGSFEMRVHAARHAASLVHTAARVLTASGEANALAVVVERVRSGAMRASANGTPIDLTQPALTVALQQLRQAEQEDPSGPEVPRLRDHVRTLTRQDSARTGHGLSSDQRDSRSSIEPRAGELLLTYVAAGDRLVRVEHWGHRGATQQPTLFDCGERSMIEQLARQVAFVGRQMARRSKLSTATGTQLVDRHEQLCALLAGCLLPAELPDRVVLNPPPSLAALPWAGFGSLIHTPHVVSPSLAFAHQRLPSKRTSAVVAGSSEPLPHVADEVAAVSAIYGVTGLIDPAQSFVRQIGSSTIAHLAGHFARSGSDPLFSHVELGDANVSAHDVLATKRTPAITVLSTCESGRSSQVGECAIGFGTALLAAGTRSIVVSQTLVQDGPATVEQMTALHRAIHAGAGPAVALAQIRSNLDPAERAVAASWLTLGAGW